MNRCTPQGRPESPFAFPDRQTGCAAAARADQGASPDAVTPVVASVGVSTHVVRFASAGIAADPGLLTAAELTRRDRLRRSEDGTAYVAAHVLARQCAAELLQVPVESVQLVQACSQCGRDGHGKPSVVGQPEVGVSLSHSSRHVAAISAWGAAGVDVETLDDDRVVEGVLSERERVWVGRQWDPGRSFRRLWVRKEALIKSGAAALDDVASLDVLTETAAAGVQPDAVMFTEWSAPDAVGAWTVRPAW